MNKKTKKQIEAEIKKAERARATLNRKQSIRLYQKFSSQIHRLKQQLEG
jgi:hypothetical protein